MVEKKSPVIPIPAKLIGKTHLSSAQYEAMYRQSVEEPEAFWAQQAKELLRWNGEWDQVLDYDYTKGFISWFRGGKLNVCENCVDRHLPTLASHPAILWEGNEPGESKVITYQELYEGVCRAANVLKKYGVRRGDRVAICMPMVPEAAIAMLACARIGAIHSVIFAGFSAEAISDRLNDASCSLVITADEVVRGTKRLGLKAIIGQAVRKAPSVRHTLVFRRTGVEIDFSRGRDLWWEEELAQVASECPCEVMEAEDPLFILYTSGSTGKPKGVLHTQAGYLLYTMITHRYVFDFRPTDIHFCAADIGWVTGHSYIVYGPLANGATTVMFESLPNYPNADRYWQTIDKVRATTLYTAPTALRLLIKEGPNSPDSYDLSSLRVLGSVGEPINHDAWMWYFERVGRGNCPIVDTWWQTETGGVLLVPLPGVTPMKPGSAMRPFFGVQPTVVDFDGNELHGKDIRGRLCIKFPWPGQMRTVFGDHERFRETYFSQHPGLYFTGDGCIRDHEGDLWITGRVDDVINVAGHRLGTSEIESAIVQSGVVAEAAVVGMPHDIKGTGIHAFCTLRQDASESVQSRAAIVDAVRRIIGGLAVPDRIQYVPGLPKTRSGKILRRVLRKIAAGEYSEFGDLTSLSDPAVVDSIVSGAKEISERPA